MFKKLAIGLLSLTVLGAVGTAIIYNVTNTDSASASSEEIAVAQESMQGNTGTGYGQQAGQGQQAGKEAQGAMAAEGLLGEPWVETGIVTAIEDTGIQMTLETGETVFVELGPADYWQNQGVSVNTGDTVMIEGSVNEGMIHATELVTNDGNAIVIRSESGQPMWSGDVNNGQEQNGNGEHTGEPQKEIDEWVTVEGTLMSFQGGNMTMSTLEGDIVPFKTGQPRFFSAQGVTFQVGDEIIVVGYYNEAGQFQAGDITQVATGARVMLLDPNGRPLWAGPGNGNGNGSNGGGGNGNK